MSYAACTLEHMAQRDHAPKKISAAEMADALLRSGYLLESRVTRVLQSINYNVEPNWTYPDPETGKPRELDIYATGDQWLDRGRGGRGIYEEVGFELLIECVNNPQPVVFFTRDDRLAKYNAATIPCHGRPLSMKAKGGKEERVTEFLKMQDFHRYCTPKHATQYCSFSQKKGSTEWMALHEDDHFLTFKKLDDALWHRFDEVSEEDDEEQVDAKVAKDAPEEAISLWFMFPILVLEGELLEVPANSRRIKPRKTDHVRFAQTVIHDGHKYVTHIDVVTERSLRRFLRVLDEEFDEIYRRVYCEGDALEAAIKGGNLVAEEPPTGRNGH
jgi:hypothetical protein